MSSPYTRKAGILRAAEAEPCLQSKISTRALGWVQWLWNSQAYEVQPQRDLSITCLEGLRACLTLQSHTDTVNATDDAL